MALIGRTRNPRHGRRFQANDTGLMAVRSTFYRSLITSPPLRPIGREVMSRMLALLLAMAGTAGGLSPAAAQSAEPVPATLRLQLVDDETGDPVEGAIVRLKGRPDTTTGPAGRVEIGGLAPGPWKAEFHAIGYDVRLETIHLVAGQVISLRYGMSFNGDRLPEIVVQARQAKVSPRYGDFHRRMAKNMGHFVTWDVINKRGYTSIGETLRGVRGVYVHCQITDCEISMSRSRGCIPAYWIDGIEGRAFATAVPIRDVYGIEVYRGSSETPGEYVSTGGCGVIVIWTKNKPYR